MIRFTLCLCLLFFLVTGCKRTTGKHAVLQAEQKTSPIRNSNTPGIDACGLLTKEEIQAVQGSAVVDTKSSENPEGEFRMSQCYYAAAEPNRSVSLTLTQPNAREPKDYWRETFGHFNGEEKERAGDKEKKESIRELARAKGEEEEGPPPRKVDGVGDEAYWTGNRVGGALYVLKNNVFIRISVGGPDDNETKLKKSKALAEKAISRL
jgi:hypothetical protein